MMGKNKSAASKERTLKMKTKNKNKTKCMRIWQPITSDHSKAKLGHTWMCFCCRRTRKTTPPEMGK